MTKPSKRILIVEDDMIIGMVLKRMLEQMNYSVLDTVQTGEGAVKAAFEHSPDLILMDIQLDDKVDGIEAMSQIKQQTNIPVIYITGNSDKYYRNRAARVGCQDYMVKPIRMEDLKQSISNLFNKQQLAS